MHVVVVLDKFFYCEENSCERMITGECQDNIPHDPDKEKQQLIVLSSSLQPSRCRNDPEFRSYNNYS
jgi:hypothetical protein